MAKSKSASRKTRTQYAALPYRIGDDGAIEVMLVTSRETRRWIVPKGWPIKGLKPHETAAREAFEEAGVVGRVNKRPIASFQYEKRLKDGATVTCDVELFPFHVEQQRKRWPEQDERDGRWFSLEDAAAAVAEAELSEAIRRFDLSLVQATDQSRADKGGQKSSSNRPKV